MDQTFHFSRSSRGDRRQNRRQNRHKNVATSTLLTATVAVIFTLAASGARAASPTNENVLANFASEATGARMETTNTTESAPLNVVSRAYARVEPYLDATVETQRLTYRALQPRTVNAASLSELLTDLSGEDEAHVTSLNAALTEAQVHAAIEMVAVLPPDIKTANAHDAVAALAGAVRAAMERNDVKAYAAAVENGPEASQVFILVDEETSDILLITVTRSNEKRTAGI